VGRPRGTPSENLVKQRTRRQRLFRDNLKKAGIWLFLVVFVLSVVGVAVVTFR